MTPRRPLGMPPAPGIDGDKLARLREERLKREALSRPSSDVVVVRKSEDDRREGVGTGTVRPGGVKVR